MAHFDLKGRSMSSLLRVLPCRRALRIMSVMIICPHCGKKMTDAYVMDQLPKSMIIAEGARAMTLSRPHKLSRQQAQKAADARWHLVKMAKSLDISNAHKMTKLQLHEAIDKIFN
jgi:hypothetical protein